MSSTDQLPASCPPRLVEVVGQMPVVAQTQAEIAGYPTRPDEAEPVRCSRWLTENLVIDRWPTVADAAEAIGNQSVLAREIGGPIPAEISGWSGQESKWTMLTRSQSWPASMVTSHPDPGQLAIGVGASLKRLHDLDVKVVGELRGSNVEGGLEGAAVDSWDRLASQVRSELQSSRFVSAQLPEPYNRYGADQLLEMFEGGRPASADNVVSHGNFTPANVLVADGRPAGLLGLSAVRIIDRHFDMARMHLAISGQIGSEAVFGFYEGYGMEPNLIAVDHYIFAHTLLQSSAKF